MKDSSGQGFKGSSEMLKNCKELKFWQKSYELFKDIKNNSKIHKETKIRSNKKICCVYYI